MRRGRSLTPLERSDEGGSRRRSPSLRGGRGEFGSDYPNGCSLLVGNVRGDCTAADIRTPFERYGVVTGVSLPKDYCTRQPRGFGYVQFSDPGDAATAQRNLNHRIFLGRVITVEFAKTKRQTPEEMDFKEMQIRERIRGRAGYGGSHRGSRSGYARSRSRSRTRSPQRHGNALSRSPSPARSPRRSTEDRSTLSPQRSGHRRHSQDGPREVLGSPGNEPRIREPRDRRQRSVSSESTHGNGRRRSYRRERSMSLSNRFNSGRAVEEIINAERTRRRRMN